MKKNPAVKSMLQLGFYLVLLIGMWMVISLVVFPDADKEEDTYATYVTQYEGVLTQLAENAIDSTQYAGIATADEVQTILSTQQISEVVADEYGAMFVLPSSQTEISRAIVYRADGEYRLPSEVSDWTRADADSMYWQGGLAGKGYVLARALSEHFFYQEIYIPA